MEILTAEMAAQLHGLVSQVHIPMGQAAQGVTILNAIASIANGQHVVIPASEKPDEGQKK